MTDNHNRNNDPVARVEALAAKAAERARRNREMFPETARIIDLFKNTFGADQIRVGYARENGHTIGTPMGFPSERTLTAKDMVFPQQQEPESQAPQRKRKRR